jgi:hypothetical protein
MWCRIALKFPLAYNTKPCAVYYMNSMKSLCYNRNLVQIYPVMEEIEYAIRQAKPPMRKHMVQYLSKLRIDYAVRLIRAHRFRDFFAAMARVPSLMMAKRVKVFCYLVKEIVLIAIEKAGFYHIS